MHEVLFTCKEGSCVCVRASRGVTQTVSVSLVVVAPQLHSATAAELTRT